MAKTKEKVQLTPEQRAEEKRKKDAALAEKRKADVLKAEQKAEAKRQKEAALYEKRKAAHSAMMKQAMELSKTNPKAAAKMGLSFPELCDRILSSAKFDRMK